MKQFTTFCILKDSEAACAVDSFPKAQTELIEELFESVKHLIRNLDWIKPDEPEVEEPCQYEYVAGAFGIPVLIRRQYHRYSAGVKISATIQERYW